MVIRLLSLYRNVVKRRPLVSQIATAGILTSAGDALAQLLERRSSGYDIKRTAVMSACGFCYFGPVVSTWLMLLKWLNFRRTIITVACDQILASPVITGGYVLLHPILSGKTLQEAKTIFKTSYVDLMKTSWMVWAPAQSINFAFVPFEFRMLYIQSIAIAWNTFLSYRSNACLEQLCSDNVVVDHAGLVKDGQL